MQPAAEAQNSLSLERKLKLHEARESIIGRLASNLPTSINLDSFLQVIVAELGQMMEVDRCDIIKLTPDGGLNVSHEWRASENVPSSVEMRIPVDVETLSQYLDIRKPIKLDDTSAPDLDHKIRFFAKSLGTRSLLIVPVVLDDEVLGLIGDGRADGIAAVLRRQRLIDLSQAQRVAQAHIGILLRHWAPLQVVRVEQRVGIDRVFVERHCRVFGRGDEQELVDEPL